MARKRIRTHPAPKQAPAEDHTQFQDGALTGTLKSGAPSSGASFAVSNGSGWSVALMNSQGIEVTSRHPVQDDGSIRPFSIPAGTDVQEFVIYRHQGGTASPMMKSMLPTIEHFARGGEYILSAVQINGQTLTANTGAITAMPKTPSPAQSTYYSPPHFGHRYVPDVQTDAQGYASHNFGIGRISSVGINNPQASVRIAPGAYQVQQDRIRRDIHAMQLEYDRAMLKDFMAVPKRIDSGAVEYKPGPMFDTYEEEPGFDPVEPFFETHGDYHDRVERPKPNEPITSVPKSRRMLADIENLRRRLISDTAYKR